MTTRTHSERLLIALVITLAGLWLCSPRLAAQARGQGSTGSAVTAAPSVHVSSDRPNDPFFETALAVDPNDSRHLIGAAMEFMRDGTSGSAVYVSWDGGATWTRSRRVGTDSTVFRGLDPVVLFGPDGTPFYVASDDRVRVHRSLDGGRTWLPGVVVPGGGYDREWVGVDRTGRYRGRMYLAGLLDVDRLDGSRNGTIAISISKDSGKTFGEPTRWVEADDGSMMAMGLTVTPDGTVLIPYQTGVRNAARLPNDSASIRVMRSTDGGRTFSRASVVVNTGWPASIRPRAIRAGPLTAIEVDTTAGAFGGWVYLAWTEYAAVGPGAGFRVRVASSADTGRSWVVTTANDNTAPSDNATPALAVNRDGVVGLTWYDRRADPDGRCHHLYFTASVDGGRTFLPNVLAGGNRPTCPSAAANWTLLPYAYIGTDRLESPDGLPVNAVGFFSPASRFQNAGDTQGLVADSAGRFHSLWIGAGDRGVTQLWSTTISVDPGLASATRVAAPVDVTSDIKLDVSPSTIDVERRSITLSMTAVNETQHEIRGPLLLTLVKPETMLEGMRATNADNGQPGAGARWQIAVGSDSVLTPGERSETRLLRFVYDGGSPLRPDSVEPARFRFRITVPGTASTSPNVPHTHE